MSISKAKKMINIICVIIAIFALVLTVYLYSTGVFTDFNSLNNCVKESPVGGPLIFILIQIIQVVIPIIPGGISLAAGVLIFGPFWGFIYNYVGIVIGSLILFIIGRHFGRSFVRELIGEKFYKKYCSQLGNQPHFEKIFALIILFPIAPDDAFCLLASLTNISFKKYSLIIFLAKPAPIFLYSLALMQGGRILSHLLL